MSVGAERREYLAVKEAAVLLRVSPSSVYRAVGRGSLASVRLSERGAIRIPRAALAVVNIIDGMVGRIGRDEPAEYVVRRPRSTCNPGAASGFFKREANDDPRSQISLSVAES